jgi:hypothetical protein
LKKKSNGNGTSTGMSAACQGINAVNMNHTCFETRQHVMQVLL